MTNEIEIQLDERILDAIVDLQVAYGFADLDEAMTHVLYVCAGIEGEVTTEGPNRDDEVCSECQESCSSECECWCHGPS